MTDATASPQPHLLQLGTDLWTLRDEVQSGDAALIRGIVESTGVFHAFEVDVAVELVEDRLQNGTASGYHFLIAERPDGAAGYVCYGEIACTSGSYDVYWIAVTKACQGAGLGRALLTMTEQRIAARGGRKIYLETSGRPDYLPTRTFYERCQYTQAAELPDFYADHDAKIVYVKDVRTR